MAVASAGQFEKSLYCDASFGSAWKISDDFSVDMYWSIVNFDLQQNIEIKEEVALIVFKGPFFPCGRT